MQTNTLTKLDKFLLSYSKIIDDVDMFTGPFFDAAGLTSSETLNTVAHISRILEYGALKIPFAAIYLAKTRDFYALVDWLPRELLALTVPYGGALQIFRRYEKATRSYYNVKRK